MFTPPADDVKPIPVPDEIYTQCITDAARYFGIDAELVLRCLTMKAVRLVLSAGILTALMILAQCRSTHPIYLK